VIEVSLRWTGSDYARQAQHQQKDIPAHANQIQRGRKSYDPPDRDALALSEKLRSGEVIVSNVEEGAEVASAPDQVLAIITEAVDAVTQEDAFDPHRIGRRA